VLYGVRSISAWKKRNPARRITIQSARDVAALGAGARGQTLGRVRGWSASFQSIATALTRSSAELVDLAAEGFDAGIRLGQFAAPTRWLFM